MTDETINKYTGPDTVVKGHVEVLEIFIGDVDSFDYNEDSTFDTSDAVTALNGLIAALAAKDAETRENDRLKAELAKLRTYVTDIEPIAKVLCRDFCKESVCTNQGCWQWGAFESKARAIALAAGQGEA